MKILFPYMARWKAVNWTRYHSLFNCIAEMGHEIFVLQPPPLKSTETNFQEIEVVIHPNIHLIDIEVNRSFWNRELPLNKIIKKGVYSLVSLQEAKKLIERENIDIIFLYNIPQYLFLKIKKGIKIFDLADDYVAMLEHEFGALSNPFIKKIGNWLLNEMVRKSDITLSVSNVLAKRIESNVKVIPNGVDLKKINNDNYIIKVNLELKKPVIGFLGSFEYFIDFDLILNTARKLSEYTFLMVGGGRKWKSVLKRASNMGLKNVILTGGVPHAQVFSYIDNMDICLNIFKKIPISHGACPIKLFEYLAMKKPVISTRLDELKYIDKGFIFYADTVEEMVGVIERILSDKSLVNEYVEKGYKTVIDNYTWQGISAKFMEIVNLKN